MQRRRTATCLLALIAALCGTGCGGAKGSGEPTTLVYQVDGMHCDGCVQAITDKVTHLDGVTTCRVNLQDRRAEVLVRDPSLAPAVQKAMETLGYKVKPLDATSAPTTPATKS